MINEFETRILGLIDELVEHGSDDELFASGYLQGHLTLAVAAIEQTDDHSAEQLQKYMQSSLQDNIQTELSPRDQVLVTEMWERLYQQACHLA